MTGGAMNSDAMTDQAMPLHLPGLTSITRLKVYDSPAPDGQRGGTPHMHLLCSEMYFVLAGSGAVEMIDANGFSRVELRPNDALTFTPGTIHRLINPNGDLELLILMEHNGLPESGDNVVCLEEHYLADDATFAEAMRAPSLEAAYQRRDRGVNGFLKLKAAFTESESTGRASFERFLQLALARTAPFRAGWLEILQNEQAAAAAALNQHQALDKGQIDNLLRAEHGVTASQEATRLGFCGHLHRYPAPVADQHLPFKLEGLQSS